MVKEDFSDYYCRAENILGKAVAKSELVELRVISLTDSSKIFTTKSTSTTVNKTQDFNQLFFKTTTKLPEAFEGNFKFCFKKLKKNFLFFVYIEFHLPTTNARIRHSKNPLYRSNQLNHSRMLSNIYSSNKILNYPRNYFSTTRYLELENKCYFLYPNHIYYLFILFVLKMIL